MKDLVQQFEDHLWACCPLPEWEYLCVKDEDKIRTVLFTNGKPLNVPVERQFLISEIEANRDALETFSRKIVEDTIMVIVAGIEWAGVSSE